MFISNMKLGIMKLFFHLKVPLSLQNHNDIPTLHLDAIITSMIKWPIDTRFIGKTSLHVREGQKWYKCNNLIWHGRFTKVLWCDLTMQYLTLSVLSSCILTAENWLLIVLLKVTTPSPCIVMVGLDYNRYDNIMVTFRVCLLTIYSEVSL